ncbi:uncharacterized protein LOC127100654 [Lathyrus oleraceus]|uniref:uncharacterized protein LOC127100654 n=1 Tax=Pisum sativum TaxID=3888 RepID=UPI0021CE4F7A|nr:uncharacterized protein LOC127100654 [Pisum sativum]
MSFVRSSSSITTHFGNSLVDHGLLSSTFATSPHRFLRCEVEPRAITLLLQHYTRREDFDSALGIKCWLRTCNGRKVCRLIRTERQVVLPFLGLLAVGYAAMKVWKARICSFTS